MQSRSEVSVNFLLQPVFHLTLDSRIHATEAIAFSSPGLVPALTNSFWMDYSVRVLLEGFHLQDALPYMLSSTSTSPFVRHTNLLYVRIPRTSTKPITCSELVWTHPDLRPFSRRFPANCPECGCMDSFARPIKLTPKGSTKYVFVCDGTNIAGKECLHELTVEPMDGFEPYGRSQNGARWMLRTEQVSI